MTRDEMIAALAELDPERLNDRLDVEHVCAVCGSKARPASNFCGPICDLAFRDYFERTFGGPDDAA